MDAVGGGQVNDALAGMLTTGAGKINNNALLRASQKVGRLSESSAHFMLGFDGAMRGLDTGMATARVKRFLFDYQDVSAADENIRSVVPFWIWMSRNLPLQVVNQWANPRAYQIYGNFVRSMSEDREEDEIVPRWMDNMGAFKLSGDTYATPDFGFNRLGETINQLGDPTQLLSNVNPLLRVPIEGFARRQFYNDIPISETPEPLNVPGLGGPLGALAEALGAADRNAEGERVVDPVVNYYLKNLLPPVAQAQRLFPTTERGQDNRGNALLGYFGVPIRNITDSDRQGELSRREREIREMQEAARRLGFTP
jgi:hypothetical protein